MKKALVLSLAFALGLGLAAWGQSWAGTWDTDVYLVPGAALFADFVSAFDSDLTITYTVGGWDFEMDADFSAKGLDGLGFEAGGSLGAFVFSADIDFGPMKAIGSTTVYTGLSVQTSSTCLTDYRTWTYTGVTVTNLYAATFDDLTITGDVSIAGVDLGGLFYLKGTDQDQNSTYTTWAFAQVPLQLTQLTGQTTAPTAAVATVASSTTVGSGWKFTVGGSFGGATISTYTYFNLSEMLYNPYQTAIVEAPEVFIRNSLKKSGYISLVCDGCGPYFTELYVLVEGLAAFGDCLVVDMAIDFNCCGFGGVDFLFKDISLGFAGITIDFLVGFTTTTKSMTLEPEIVLADSCFSIAAELVFSTNVFSGIEIEGLSYSKTFNGVTVGFAATWDQTDNPLIGDDGTITKSSDASIFVWKPDTHASVRTIGSAVGAVDADGIGNYVLAELACSKQIATVINQMSLDFDGDGCCGGAFSVSMDTYFGSITEYSLIAVYGTYYIDLDNSGVYGATGTAEAVEWLGAAAGYDDYLTASASTSTAPPSITGPSSVDTDCVDCVATNVVAESLKFYGWYGATGTTISKILGWVETDVDLSIAINSNVTLTLGMDLAWWGWEAFDFGITFEW